MKVTSRLSKLRPGSFGFGARDDQANAKFENLQLLTRQNGLKFRV